MYGMEKSKRILDNNGYVVIKDNPITKAGVFEYLGSEVGLPPAPNEEDRVYKVYRPASEISTPEFLEKLNLKPITDFHQFVGKNLGETGAVQVGTTGEQATFADPYVLNTLMISDPRVIDELDAGKKDLSLGYLAEYSPVPGEHNGEPYDLVQRNLTPNHLAIVPEGRSGKDVAVLDQKSTTSTTRVMTYDAVSIKKLTTEVTPMSEAPPMETDALPDVSENSEQSTPPNPEENLKNIRTMRSLLQNLEKSVMKKEDSDDNSDKEKPATEDQDQDYDEVSESETEEEPASDQDDDEETVKETESETEEEPDNSDDDDDYDDDDDDEDVEKEKVTAETEDKAFKKRILKRLKAQDAKLKAQDTQIKKLLKRTSLKHRAADAKKRETLAKQLHAKLGVTCDHSAMTARELAIYGLRKAQLDAPAGAEEAVLNAFLKGKQAPTAKPAGYYGAPDVSRMFETGDSAATEKTFASLHNELFKN